MTDTDQPAPSNISVLAMCPCERAPKRKGQRNCHLCNVEANKKHRVLKREREKAALSVSAKANVA